MKMEQLLHSVTSVVRQQLHNYRTAFLDWRGTNNQKTETKQSYEYLRTELRASQELLENYDTTQIPEDLLKELHSTQKRR